VRRFPTHDASEGDDTRETPRLRKRHRSERQLECARDGHDRDRPATHAQTVELLERALEQTVRDLPVETRRDDRDTAASPVRLALEQADVVRDVELALGMLSRRAEPRDRLLVLVLRLPLRLGFELAQVALRRLVGLDDRFFVQLERLCLVARPAIARSSTSNLRSWWCSLCPSLSRLVAR